MKTSSLLLKTIFFLSASLLITELAQSQERRNTGPRNSPNAAVSQTIGTTVVDITYGRPSVRDREIFGGLEPFDRVWRTGADEATTIRFSGDVMVGGEIVPAGIYSLFTIPGEDEWTIILNSEVTQWGAFNYNSEMDVIRVTTTPQTAHHMEQFMIYFENVTAGSAHLVLHWAGVKVSVEVSVAD
jgi:hypothetical protein